MATANRRGEFVPKGEQKKGWGEKEVDGKRSQKEKGLFCSPPNRRGVKKGEERGANATPVHCKGRAYLGQKDSQSGAGEKKMGEKRRP